MMQSQESSSGGSVFEFFLRTSFGINFFLGMLILSVFLFPLSCGGKVWASQISASAIRERGVLRVLLENEDWAYFLQWNDEKPSGFCVDLAEAVGEALGVSVSYEALPWGNNEEGSITGILQGAPWGPFDMIASTVTATPERGQWVHFSEPYAFLGQMVLARPGDARVLSLENLKNKWVGFPGNTTSEIAARNFLQSSRLVPLSGDAASTFRTFREGLVDAIVIDSPLAVSFLKQYPETEVLDKLLTRESYALVLPLSSDTEYKNIVNRVIAEQKKVLEDRWIR